MRLRQSDRPPRAGAAEVGRFFSFYDAYPPVRLVPARAEGRDVLLAVEADGDARPAYVLTVDWRAGRVVRLRDTRYVRYVMDLLAIG